jgi:5,10-methylenetetrahydromethanopterin reductase
MENTSFTIGVMLWLDQPVYTLPALARSAEGAGFGEIWLADHYFLRDVYVSLAIIAQATQKARLGTAVTAVQLRHPALIASSAATIDDLSCERAIIGIGPGGFEFPAQFGMNPKSPLTMLREAVAVMRGVLRGDSQVRGSYFSAVGSKLTWQAREIPIHIAARGPAMTELAGEIADGVLVHGINQKYVEYVKELLAKGAQRAGRAADSCEMGVILDIDMDENAAAAVDRLRSRLKITAGGSWSDSLIPYYDLDEAKVVRLKKAVSSGDPNAAEFVTDEMVHTFGIAGSRKHITETLGRLRAAGFRRVILKFEGTQEEVIHHMQAMTPLIQELTT